MKLPRIHVSRRHLVFAGGVAAVIIGTVILVTPYATNVDESHLAAATSTAIRADAELIPGVAPSTPVALRIPKLSVSTNFVPLGLEKDGTIQVPKGYTEVGWYRLGTAPGAVGPAVVLGHVDSHNGPGVFFYLGQLQPGDVVHIDRADGTTLTFKVQTLERYYRNNFPSQKVYGPIPYAGLRLITCSGTYSHTMHTYDRVLVVYAELVGTASTTPTK